jgi:hypothetical protein
MNDKETADIAYWERNMLALHFAQGWYPDDVPLDDPDGMPINGVYMAESRPRFAGWRRVLSLGSGTITFHIPDDFDVGDLPLIKPNWDGHTTEQKWQRILKARSIDV